MPTPLRGLHEHPGRVGAEIRLAERLGVHGLDDRPGQIGQLRVPAADRGAGQRQTVPRVDALEAVERLVILPAADDRVGQHARAGPAAQDGQIGRIADQHLHRPLARRVLGDELRPDHPHDDARGAAALEHFAHLFPDAAEVFEPALLHLERDQLDVDAREMRGQRLAAARRRPLVGADPPRRGGLRRAVLREEGLDERERELALVRGDAFGLLAEQPPLELLVVFPQLLVEGLVLIAGGGRGGEGLFELGHACEEVVRRCRHGGGHSRLSVECKRCVGARSPRPAVPGAGTPCSRRASAAPSMRTPGPSLVGSTTRAWWSRL